MRLSYRHFFCLTLFYYRDTLDFTEEQVKNLENVFRQNLHPNKEKLTLKEFKKLMPSKNVYIYKY